MFWWEILCYNFHMSKEVAVDGNLAAQVRRLFGGRSARAAAEAVLREYVLQNKPNNKSAKDGAEENRKESQFERIRKSAEAIARRGDPFYPGFNHKDLRKNRDFG